MDQSYSPSVILWHIISEVKKTIWNLKC